MSKINLTDATSLTNETSFLTALNANSALIETASDNFLSLDGTSPNSMAADLDMDSNRILNLPTPVFSNDPVRLQDMVTFTGGGTIAAFPSTSAGVASAVSDETGSGSLVFGTSPTLATPTITNPTVTTGTYSAPVLTSPTVTTKISPTTDDGAPLGDTTHQFSDLFLASGSVINWNAGDVTLTHASNTLSFAGASSGYVFDAPLGISTNDGAALGTSAASWSDLFLASGAVINFNAGNVTLTHSAGTLTTNALWSSTAGMYILSGTAATSGGSATAGYRFSNVPSLGVYYGTGAPTFTAAHGSLYLNIAGTTTSSRLYVNTNDSTGWTAVTTAT